MVIVSSIAAFRENTNRQAKRLNFQFKIPLTTAKEVLAKALYRCANWADLQARFRSGALEEHIVLLASLPNTMAAQQYFIKQIDQFARSLSQQIQTNFNLAELYEKLRLVFALPNQPTTWSDIALSLAISDWQSAGIGPDPCAVIEAQTMVNGLPMRLIGTRVYLPKYYQFGPEVTHSVELAEPYRRSFQIIWTNPDAWYKAAYDFLIAPDDQVGFEPKLPVERLDDDMERHQQWFERTLSTWYPKGRYGDHGEDFMPYMLPKLGGCYLIFGVAGRLASNLDLSVENKILLTQNEENDNLVVLIDDQPVCLEWISVDRKTKVHEGEFPKYFDALQRGVLSHQSCDLKAHYLNSQNSCTFFITPAHQFAIDQMLKVEFTPTLEEEVFVCSTNEPSIASIVLGEVAARDIWIYPSEYEESSDNSYLLQIDVSEYKDLRNFSLLLEASGQEWFCVSNLVTRSIFLKEGGGIKLLLVISAELLSLMDVFGKKALENALHSRLVLRRPKGFHEALERAPKRCQELTLPPQELIDSLRSFSKKIDISLFDLLRCFHVKEY